MSTRIDITTLDGLKDLLIVNERPKLNGLHMVDLITDQVYKRLDGTDYIQQPVQSVSWNKYELRLIGLEDYTVELLKYAKKVRITHLSSVYDCVILSIARERVGGSDFLEFVVEFYDVNLDNYLYALPPVHNYLRSDALAEQFSFSQMVVLRVIFKQIRPGEENIFDFNSMLVPDDTTKAPELKSFENTTNGATVSTNIVIKQQWQAVFYLNGNDAANFAKVVPLADGWNVSAYLYAGSSGRQSMESPEITIEKLAGFDIWKASINLVYDIINNYNYGSN